jgi:hypothetical protein
MDNFHEPLAIGRLGVRVDIPLKCDEMKFALFQLLVMWNWQISGKGGLEFIFSGGRSQSLSIRFQFGIDPDPLIHQKIDPSGIGSSGQDERKG